MIDCIVCHYWSERLEDTRSRRSTLNVRDEERQLIAVLRGHQREGACATRLPRLLPHLVKRAILLSDETSKVYIDNSPSGFGGACFASHFYLAGHLKETPSHPRDAREVPGVGCDPRGVSASGTSGKRTVRTEEQRAGVTYAID